jgi:hypothetical protein
VVGKGAGLFGGLLRSSLGLRGKQQQKLPQAGAAVGEYGMPATSKTPPPQQAQPALGEYGIPLTAAAAAGPPQQEIVELGEYGVPIVRTAPRTVSPPAQAPPQPAQSDGTCDSFVRA